MTQRTLRSSQRKLPAHAMSVLLLLLLIILLLSGDLYAQAEAESAPIRLGRLWVGVSANGAKASFNYLAGYFPNDYNIFGNRGQDAEGYGGMGLVFTATDWKGPLSTDTVVKVAVYGPTNDYMPIGQVVDSLRSYIRYQYPAQVIDFSPVGITYPGIYDQSKFAGHSFDQLIEVTTQHVFQVQVHRKIMSWAQSFNDDYSIVDLELTNVGTDTLNGFYVSMNEGNGNMQLSSIRNPVPASGEFPTSLAATWMHYYGGRVGDTMRVFYEYNADNPDLAGDNMGAPSVSQGGRLLYAQMTYYAILHASAAPYDDPSGDVDDFLQPRVTYIGNSTRFPNAPQGDEFGDKNFYAIRGAYADAYPDAGGPHPDGTHHGLNNDDRNNRDYSQYPAGLKSATNNHKRFSSFGPYTFPPGKKLHIVYASGLTGISLQRAREIGEKWQQGTLDAPDTNWLPSTFAFPTGATENDRRKDVWIATGIDSVMKSAWRAKWNYEHNYNIPPSAPPPDQLAITGHGDGIEVKWSDAAAEALPNFEGYRIMRRLGNSDTVYYQELYSSDASDKALEHVFRDTTAKVGAQYYYYLQSKVRIAVDDPNADPSTRGQIMYSSRLLVPDISGVVSRFPPQDDLSKIRIAPNPFNISDPLLAQYGWESSQDYGLLFINLPPTVTIRIFTENGDLVLEYLHNDPVKSGLWKWNMISRNQQVINSGVYIALFETPDGSKSYQKFVVVR